jgi:putative hemolysin
MNGANLVMLLVIIVLLFALIFLAIAEMGLSKMTKPRAAAITEDKPRIEPSLTALVDNPEGWINPLLLMVNVCQTVQATLTGIVAGNLFGGVGVAVGVTLNVIVFFVLAEAVPKTYAVLNPDRAAMIAARPVRALTAFPPLRMISEGLIGLTNVLVKGRGLESGPFVSEQEFLGIVEAAAQDEVIEHEERELIESIIEFGDTVAREVMVPRPDMVMVANTATITDALNLGIAHGFSRLPVSGSDEDDIVGLAFTKDLMRAEREGRGDLPVLDLARDVTFIPENKPVARLMREMQDSKFHIAIVADEYGDIAGLVTLEDCLEELVGEIVDEYDAEEHDIERFDDGTLLVDGGRNIGDVAGELGIDIPNEDFDSVGGFVFSALERVPEPGDAIDFEGFAFVVESVEGRRVRRVRITPAPQDGGDDSAAEASSD